MATVTKTFSFLANAEGLVDTGGSAAIAFSHEPLDGSPVGCVKSVNVISSTTAVEYARHPVGTATWQSWGVPAGSTVTAVRVVTFAYRPAAVTRQAAGGNSLIVNVIRDDGSAVSGLSLVNFSWATVASALWSSTAGDGLRAVSVGSQASTTGVRLELRFANNLTSGGGANVDHRFDEIVLEITYTPPAVIGAAAVNAGSDQVEVGTAVRTSVAVTDPGSDQTTAGTAVRISASTADNGSDGLLTGLAARTTPAQSATGTAEELSGVPIRTSVVLSVDGATDQATGIAMFGSSDMFTNSGDAAGAFGIAEFSSPSATAEGEWSRADGTATFTEASVSSSGSDSSAAGVAEFSNPASTDSGADSAAAGVVGVSSVAVFAAGGDGTAEGVVTVLVASSTDSGSVEAATGVPDFSGAVAATEGATEQAQGNRALCRIATEQVQPQAITELFNLSGSVADVQDDPFSPDAGWLEAVLPLLSTELAVSFPTPVTTPTGGLAVQQFAVRVRPSFLLDVPPLLLPPTVTVLLLENGTPVGPMVTTTVPTERVVLLDWDASVLTDPLGSGVECRVVGLASVLGLVGWTVEVGAVRWTSSSLDCSTLVTGGSDTVADPGTSGREALPALAAFGAVDAAFGGAVLVGESSAWSGAALSAQGRKVVTASKVVEGGGTASSRRGTVALLRRCEAEPGAPRVCEVEASVERTCEVTAPTSRRC